MKMIIEVSGGLVASITATQECEIYIIDHDNLKERGEDQEYSREVYQPDCITNEGSHVAFSGASETPEFDKLLDEALEPYRDEEAIYQEASDRVGGGDTGLFCGVIPQL